MSFNSNTTTRRNFINFNMRAAAGAAIGLSASAALLRSIEAQAAAGGWQDDEAAAGDEAFWISVAQAFPTDGRYLILNGGGNNPQVRDVVEALTRYEAHAAAQPRPNNGQLLARIEQHRARLARHLGCGSDEVAITRNTTEGLNIVVHGIDMKPGDEVVYTSFDAGYGARPLRLRAARQGITLREVALPIPPGDDEVVRRIAAALSDRTRLVLASHVADGWGFVLPIARIAAEAHRRGIPVLADGALSFGHLLVDVRQLGCDYFATSLHKWLGAPFGTGLLYVRRERIGALWPLYGADQPQAADVRKFEEIGTRSGATIAAIGQALDFHETIGPARKAARLRYLGSYVLQRLAGEPRIRCFTDATEARRGSLMRIVIAGMKGEAVANALRDKHGIWTYGNLGEEWDGIYISPNLFNLPPQLDRFVSAMREIARER